MFQLGKITIRIGTGYRYLNIDQEGREIGHIRLSSDGAIADVWADDIRDKASMNQLAECCRLAIISAEKVRESANSTSRPVRTTD